ncbi:MAG: hypothetical protein IT256_00825 [Chitinophagaceae bacterium]|nr:hypothetical protein [Chitinophagaceae bacterium]
MKPLQEIFWGGFAFWGLVALVGGTMIKTELYETGIDEFGFLQNILPFCMAGKEMNFSNAKNQSGAEIKLNNSRVFFERFG